MSATATTQNTSRDSLLIPLASAFVITFFLFFIDEGYYDFRWMMSWGNWIVFVVYLVLLFPIQWAVAHFLFRRLEGWKAFLSLVVFGITATFLFFWLVL
jgi:hypothetical protein